MTKLQIVLILACISFMYLAFRAFKRNKISLITFCFFFLGWGTIAVFSLKIQWLNAIGITFWLNRWAELIVYFSIIILFYIVFHLLNIISKNWFDLTRLISTNAINKAYDEVKDQLSHRENSKELDDFVFNIRVYNEAKVLWKTIDEIVAYGVRKMVFINDGSRDNSLDILEEKKKQYPKCLIVIISHTINRGWGAANKTGYNFIKKYAKALNIKRVVWFDPDWQMDIKDMERFQKAIQNNKNVDLFLWSRFIKGAKSYDMPTSRRIILRLSKIITRLFYWVKVSDPHNGYRVYTLPALEKININADGMHYANEINEQIAINKLKFVEVPVDIRYTDYSLWKGQKNSNSWKLGWEMIYQKFFS